MNINGCVDRKRYFKGLQKYFRQFAIKHNWTMNCKSQQGFTLKIRIPSWAEAGTILYRGVETRINEKDANTYADIQIENAVEAEVAVHFDMPARYTVAHPLVEEANNQVAVERGPLVYCIESPDADVETLDDLFLLSNAVFRPEAYEIMGQSVTALTTEAAVVVKDKNDRDAHHVSILICFC